MHEIAFTGGPCGGKDTILAELQTNLLDYGVYPLVVPEAATIIIQSGIDVQACKADPQRWRVLQQEILLLQQNLRQRARALAAAVDHPNVVLLVNRGECDFVAYVGEDEAQTILDAVGLDRYELRDSYDGVVHLTTAAQGAEAFYTLENNQARTETPQQARELDQRLKAAWLGHSHHRIIANRGDFQTKKADTLAAVLNILGLPQPQEQEQRWLLARPPSTQRLADADVSSIKQWYLPAQHGQRRIRCRSGLNGSVWTYTEKHDIDVQRGIRSEHERVVTPNEAQELLEGGLQPGTHMLHKTRYMIADEAAVLEIDQYHGLLDGVWIAEAETDHPDMVLTLPADFPVVREITSESAWRNYQLASADGPPSS